MVKFFFRAVSDARHDPFCGVGWVHAFFWVVRHWRWLRSDTGPYFGPF